MFGLSALAISTLLATISATPVTLEKRFSNALGCYGSNAISGYTTSSTSMTLEMCSAACAKQKTAYFGVSGGDTCQCSNNIKGWMSGLGCYYACSGDLTQNCGGWLTQAVYAVDYSASAQTTTAKLTSTSTATQATTAKPATTTSSSTTTSSTRATTTSSTSSTSTASTTSTTSKSPSTTSSTTVTPTSTSSSTTTSSTLQAATTSPTSTSSSTSAPAVATPVQTAVPVSGYDLQQSGLTAAANGANFRSAYVLPDGYNVAGCAASCTADSGCLYFNIYQQSVGTTFQDVCVLWGSVQSASDFNNYWNNGLWVSYSAGYAKSATAATTSSAAIAAVPTTSGSCSSVPVPAGYTSTFTCLSAAADGGGYLSAYTDTAATTYAGLVNDCAASCNGDSNCASFNVYQEASGVTNICVLWSVVKTASDATNYYNNGITLANSNAYAKGASSASSTTSAASTATATSCPNLAPGYAVCKNGQTVVNGACVGTAN